MSRLVIPILIRREEYEHAKEAGDKRGAPPIPTLGPWARVDPRNKHTRYLQPVGVRTLRLEMKRPRGWDFRRMPNDSLGAEGTRDALLDRLWDLLSATKGGDAYLMPDAETRALTVLATTMATVLQEPGASISDRGAKTRIIRPDVYEAAVEGMRLGEFFQAVRSVLEIHHPAHVPVVTPWPYSTSPARDLGILEWGGKRELHLELNAPRIRLTPETALTPEELARRREALHRERLGIPEPDQHDDETADETETPQ